MSVIAAAITQVVLLGTGTPSADPERSGPATAVVVDDSPYLVDFGAGVVRRAASAVAKGVSGLRIAICRSPSSRTCTPITRWAMPISSLRRGSPGETRRCNELYKGRWVSGHDLDVY